MIWQFQGPHISQYEELKEYCIKSRKGKIAIALFIKGRLHLNPIGHSQINENNMQWELEMENLGVIINHRLTFTEEG